jgi:hypothetical protein
MAFNIRMGVPGMEAAWNDLLDRAGRGQLDKEEQKFYRKLVKALGYLRENPRHNSLASHEIGFWRRPIDSLAPAHSVATLATVTVYVATSQVAPFSARVGDVQKAKTPMR